MWIKASKLKEILGISTPNYTRYIHRKFLVSSMQSKGRGVPSRYNASDIRKNFVFTELVDCRMEQKLAHTLALQADVSSAICEIELNENTMIVLNLANINDVIEELKNGM